MSEGLAWFKSSYSNTEGGDCLEVALDWCKSSHSDGQGGDCLEAPICLHVIHVRDSKLGPRSPRFAVPAGAWAAFISYASHGA
ncbi:DUF397 domain-containing protein [Streptomyces kanamyceticus]|uniref:DUF397 domain-containing protein n=1 Tax=Streptomyces kanamyceticus TaxID=1967 RepID=A0A5J6GD15_STRKN|nr:DUF397 domain-containing protein [Streptomyces kanamyceticus]QEU92352.1 DUF397 domain-containing protein [Streptomyces kanamyceticus]